MSRLLLSTTQGPKLKVLPIKNDINSVCKITFIQILHLYEYNKKIRKKIIFARYNPPSGQFPNIAFSNFKIFTVKRFVNSQTDRIYLTDRSYMNLSHQLAPSSRHLTQIMVSGAVPVDGRSSIFFIEPGVKVNTQ